MTGEHIQPEGLFDNPVYSQVVKAEKTLYVSGQVAQDSQGRIVGAGDFTAQATQVFENLKKALEGAGASFAHLVKLNIYITDPRYRPALSEVRGRYLAAPMPASTLLVVAGLAEPEYLLEIEAVAVLE